MKAKVRLLEQMVLDLLSFHNNGDIVPTKGRPLKKPIGVGVGIGVGVENGFRRRKCGGIPVLCADCIFCPKAPLELFDPDPDTDPDPETSVTLTVKDQ